MKAVWASACAVALCAFAAAVLAQSLQPFQQEALDKILASMDPALRPMMRAQLAPTLAMLNEQQVSMMLDGLAADSARAETSGDEPGFADTAASAEDIAYNRAQFEPVIRTLWQAGKTFDDFVAARLLELCPRDGQFAVFGSGWRYEVYPLAPTWPKVSSNVDLEVDIIGASYAPQDGRYDFDFSAVRRSFDEAAVKRGIAAACTEYAQIGDAFMSAARADAGGRDLPPNGNRLEQEANANAGIVRARLESLLQAEAPSGNNALHLALLNGRRVGRN
jgi:hypothetical protein